MKNHKIIETKPEVLLYRDQDENLNAIVVCQAWLTDEDDSTEALRHEVYQFPNDDAAKRFIADFSSVSAQDFLDRNAL